MSPLLDIRSAVLFAAVSVTVSLALAISVRAREKRNDYAQWLIAANCALIVVGLTMLARDHLGFEIKAILISVGMFSGLIFTYFALLQAAGDGAPFPLHRAIALGVIIGMIQGLLAAATQNVAQLIILTSALKIAIAIPMGISGWRLTRGYGGVISLLIWAPFAIIAGAYGARLIAASLWPGMTTAVVFTILIVAAMAWAAIILELGLISMREAETRKALTRALARARAANEAKSRFLRAISHELRTPLNAVLGLSELMRIQALGPMPEPYRPLVGEVHQAGTHLLEMIGDLLDFSAIESGSVRLEEVQTELGTVIDDVLGRLETNIRQARIKLDRKMNSEAIARVNADPARLGQALHHLIENAIRYSPTGGCVRINHSQSEAGGALIQISDDGPGMDREDLRRALELFGRARHSRHSTKGAGIGLPIAKSIITAHGGELAFDTAPGAGTTVALILPPGRNATGALDYLAKLRQRSA